MFGDVAETGPLDGSIRFLEGAGRRATLELVADAVLDLVREGTAPEEIAVVCPALERVRASLETAFGALGIPFAVESRSRLGATAFGQALLSLLRFTWSGGTRRELFSFLRTPYSGVARPDVDFLEGRLRGRAVLRGDRTLEETTKLRTGRPLPMLELIGSEAAPVAAARAVVRTMLRNAYGLGAPPVTSAAKRDLRAVDAVGGVLDELEQLEAGGVAIGEDDVLAALERATVRGDAAGEPGRVTVLDLARIRTRRFDAVFVIGLEQGSLPRRTPTSPFLDDDTRRELDSERGARLQRPDTASRDRYLFYTACTRPRKLLTLVREAATDDGSPREPSPFWEAVCELFDPETVRLHTTRRPLARLTWPLDEAPTERERLRALARLAADEPKEADALAFANGWQRKLGRARRAFTRPTAITHPRALALLGSRETFRVTDLERMAGCSAAWFVERYLRPGGIDQAIDPRMRGSIAHVALQRFYTQLPAAVPGAERVTPENVEAAVRLMHECVDSALETGLRIDADDLQRRELAQSMQRDLEQLVRAEAAAASTFVPRDLEVNFKGYELAPGVARERQDRPRRPRPGQRARDHRRLQVRRGAVGLADPRRGAAADPALPARAPRPARARADGRRLHAAQRRPPRARDAAHRGRARAGVRDRRLPRRRGFEAEIEHARGTAVALAERIRAGDVRHDPHGGDCPAWCDLWRMCRKERP